ncbi:MAG: hypothetical protein ACNA71_08390, partial [Kiritimatiellia bacterium]
AESKYRAATQPLQAAISSTDKRAIWEAITDTTVEHDVLNRVYHKARTYTTELYQATAQWTPQPEVIRDIYKEIIIPMNKEIQVEYLLARDQQDTSNKPDKA